MDLQPSGWHPNREGTVSLPASGGEGLGWTARLAHANSRLSVVKSNKPKMLPGLGQKATRQVQRFHCPLAWALNAVGAQREPKPIRSLQRNTVSPSRSPSGVGKPQGPPKARRVKDEGESECRPVTGRIRVETAPDAKALILPSGVSTAERPKNRQRWCCKCWRPW